VIAYAAGTLWEAARHVVQAHVSTCACCRTKVAVADAVGGALIEELPPTPLAPGAARRMWARLDNEPHAQATALPDAASGAHPAVTPSSAAGSLEALHILSQARLRWLAPGVRHAVVRAWPTGETLRLLRVRSGTALPTHSHQGAEMTLVLQGTFVDKTGTYTSGDLVEAEEDVCHQPIAEGPEDCVCLIASQGRLRFRGVFAAIFGAVARI
jgi:putative transcriptional regulator